MTAMIGYGIVRLACLSEIIDDWESESYNAPRLASEPYPWNSPIDNHSQILKPPPTSD